MTIPLKLVAANDTVSALIALGDALAGRQAVFVTPPETNGLMPEVHGLPDEVGDDIALIVESSGSTGTPKRITLGRDALLASCQASDEALGGPGQWLLALPINYIAGANVLLRSLVADTAPVMMNTSLPFTAAAFANSANFMRAERRYVSLVPTQLQRLLVEARADDFLLSKLRRFDAILVGGQAIDATVLEEAQDQGLAIVRSYGMAETAGGCVYDGIPLEEVEIEIDESGRIRVFGPMLAHSYRDGEVIAADGWLSSDIGEITNGRLHVLGRIDDQVKVGGQLVNLLTLTQQAKSISDVTDSEKF